MNYCPNCRENFSEKFVTELLALGDSLIDRYGLIFEKDIEPFFLGNCRYCEKSIFITDDKFDCPKCRNTVHLSCITKKVNNAKLEPKTRCVNCRSKVIPLSWLETDLIKREKFTFLIPQKKLWFPRQHRSQLHFHLNGEPIPFFSYKIKRVNDTYLRTLQIYVNNALIHSEVISYRSEGTINLNKNIKTITLVVTHGRYVDEGWQLEYIQMH